MYAVRQWSVRNSRKLEWLYQCFEDPDCLASVLAVDWIFPDRKADPRHGKIRKARDV